LLVLLFHTYFFFSSRRRHTRFSRDWSSDVCSSDLILARNWLPSPSPFDAPATRPAISTNSTVAGTVRCGFTISANCARRGSGTRSEERRVGKEGRGRREPEQIKNNQSNQETTQSKT